MARTFHNRNMANEERCGSRCSLNEIGNASLETRAGRLFPAFVLKSCVFDLLVGEILSVLSSPVLQRLVTHSRLRRNVLRCATSWT